MTTLALAIATYRAGLAEFNANAPMGDDAAADAYAKVSFDPPLEALRAWDKPATSSSEALLALDTAVKEIADGDHATAEALVRAAAGYLRGVNGA